MIRDTEKSILQFLSTFHFATVTQIRQLLLFGKGSYTSVLLNGLWNEKYIQRLAVPGVGCMKSIPFVYSLAPKGRNYLRDRGYAVTNHPSNLSGIADYDDLRHDLAITDFLIGGYLLANQRPDVAVIRIYHDRTIRSLIQRPVVFDGWIEFLIGGREQHCIALELERTRKAKKHFQDKVATLLHFITPDPLTKQSQYEQVFGTNVLTIAYVTQVSTSYCLVLRQWTQEVLASVHREHDADVFRFTYLPPGVVDPLVYTALYWFTPSGKNEPALLLDLEKHV